jgi:DNA-binding NarL/FixJ family response regulator
MSISIVIADDHPIILDGLANLFKNEDRLNVRARCVNGEEALGAVRRYSPDVLLIDLHMPRMTGLDVLRAIRAERLQVRAVLLAAELTRGQALDAMRLGVGGIVLKELAPRLLVECVRKVAAGEQWIEKRSFSGVLDGLLARDRATRATTPALTAREVELVRLVAGGFRNRAIAEQVGITEGTVKLHIHNVYKKLGVDSRVELTLYAQEKGIA